LTFTNGKVKDRIHEELLYNFSVERLLDQGLYIVLFNYVLKKVIWNMTVSSD